MIEKLYTVEEVAELASVTGRTIRNYLKSGRLVGRKIGGQWRFPENEVQRLLGGGVPMDAPEAPPASEVPAQDHQNRQTEAPDDFDAYSDDYADSGIPATVAHSAEEAAAPQPAQPQQAAPAAPVIPAAPAERPPLAVPPSSYAAQPAPLPLAVPPPVSPAGAASYAPPAPPQQAVTYVAPQVQPAPTATPAPQSVAPAPAPAPQAAPQPTYTGYPQPVAEPSVPGNAAGYATYEQPQAQPIPYAPAPRPALYTQGPDAHPYAYYAPPGTAFAPGYAYAPGMRPEGGAYPVYPYMQPAPLPQAYPPSPSPGGPPAVPQATVPAAADETSPATTAPTEAAAKSNFDASETVSSDEPASSTASRPDFSDVGKRVVKFISEVHDCSHGPQLCTMVELHQSISSARMTSDRLTEIANEESELGQLCQSFVEFDDRFFVARYTLFGTTSFILRCLKLVG